MNFFTQPYSFDHGGKYLLVNTFLILAIGFCFDYFLIPFERDFSEHKFEYWIISLVHVGIAAIVYFLLFGIMQFWVIEDEWTVLKEMLSLGFLLLLIGIGAYWVRDIIYDNPNNRSIAYLTEEIGHAYLSGGVVILLIININYRRKQAKNAQKAAALAIPNAESPTSSKLLPIQAAITADHFEIDPSLIVCIKSDGNYLEFYIREKNQVTTRLKRMTLQSIIQQLAGIDQFIKTHRAFVVNKTYITNISGNAQGYQLELLGLAFKVPVARSMLDHFNQSMGQK